MKILSTSEQNTINEIICQTTSACLYDASVVFNDRLLIPNEGELGRVNCLTLAMLLARNIGNTLYSSGIKFELIGSNSTNDNTSYPFTHVGGLLYKQDQIIGYIDPCFGINTPVWEKRKITFDGRGIKISPIQEQQPRLHIKLSSKDGFIVDPRNKVIETQNLIAHRRKSMTHCCISLWNYGITRIIFEFSVKKCGDFTYFPLNLIPNGTELGFVTGSMDEKFAESSQNAMDDILLYAARKRLKFDTHQLLNDLISFRNGKFNHHNI